NPQCRNHTALYVEELKQLRLWATEMFDSTSKFPTGVLFGSSFDFGNFDECVGVRVPVEGEVQGRYCLAKFHVVPPEMGVGGKERGYRGEVANASAWEKILAFSKDRSRNSRNDFHFSYCVPSSCSHADLESSLQEIAQQFNHLSDFKVTVTVNPRSCQQEKSLTLTTSDIAFISIVAFFVLVTLLATSYDSLLKLDDLQKYKLEGNKHKVLISFSVWNNLKKLISEGEDDDGLQCIHGLKVFSMFLIIMGHRIMFGVGSPLLNPNFVENMYGKIEATVLLNGPIIVDTFFNISGFLACYLMLNQFEKHHKKVKFFYLYIHRFIRLTPAYAVVLAFYCTVFIQMGSGPLWLERIEVEQERCVASWWTNIFYLNNYINKEQLCMFQSWYLTCDIHFFMMVPIIIWLLRKKPCLGLVILFLIIVVSVCVVFATVYMYEEDAILLVYMKLLKDPVINNTFKNIYIPTHMRASPYFVGMVTGYLKFTMRSRDYKMPKYMVYMGWIMSIFVIEVTVYSAFIFYIPGKPYDPLMSAVYASMHHVTWSICISWMILAISEGNGAWVEPFLAWKPLVLLSRITYTAFLCHGGIQLYSVAILRHGNYASIFTLLSYTVSDIGLAYGLGLVLSMFFEAPILRLEKILLKRDVAAEKEQKPSPKIRIINQS
ncbi:hypothetical protein Zmor_009082, partial [Zophobas morio]